MVNGSNTDCPENVSHWEEQEVSRGRENVKNLNVFVACVSNGLFSIWSNVKSNVIYINKNTIWYCLDARSFSTVAALIGGIYLGIFF